MKYSLKIFTILFLAVFLNQSCKENDKSTKNSSLTNKREDSLKLNLKVSKFEETILIPKAETLVREWPMYLDLKDEVYRLKSYTLQDVISNISTLEKVVDSLQKTIPPAVDTFPVTSRINVLNSKAKYLLLISEKQKPRLNEIKAIAEEYPLEFNALNTQLNEIFIKLPDFED